MTDVTAMQTNVEADAFLSHFGVKGMKWGKHTAGGDSGGSGGSGGGSATKTAVKNIKTAQKSGNRDLAEKMDTKAINTKPTKQKYTTQQIHDARLRDDARANDLISKASTLNLATAIGKGEKAAALAYAKSAKEYTNSPDSAIAAKMTKGEKVTTGLWAAVGAVSAAYLISGALR
jgi:hypothetical protein